MRAIWTGSLGFGLVNIPIKIYSAVQDSTLDLDMLDSKDHSNIKFKRVNEKTGKEVAFHDIVKGYEMGKEIVIVDEEDIRKATPEKYDHLSIVQFVKEKEIDARYYEKPYYLAPDKGGDRAYVLLRDALAKEGKVAIGPLVFHKREWVCLVKPLDKVLVLHRLRFPEEIRDTDSLTIPDAPIKDAEIKMAISLIDHLTKPFNPKIFKDEYTDKLLKIIHAKAKGKTVDYKPMKLVHSTTTDLMDQLKASISGSKKKVS